MLRAASHECLFRIIILTFIAIILGCAPTKPKVLIPREALYGYGIFPNYNLTLADSIKMNPGVLFLIVDTYINSLDSQPSSFSDKIIDLPEKAIVRLLDAEPGMTRPSLKVQYGNHIGYVSDILMERPLIQKEAIEEFIARRTTYHRQKEQAKKQAYEAELERLKKLKEYYESKPLYVKGLKVNLRERPNKNSKILFQLVKGDIVYLQDGNQLNSGWAKVKYISQFDKENKRVERYNIDNQEELEVIYLNGWIHSSLLSENPIEKLSYDEQRRREFLNKHKNLSTSFKEAISSGKIKRGMTEEMAIASWGYPDDKHKSSFGTSTWVYRVESYVSYYFYYLYFEDSVLVRWEESSVKKSYY